ncbi:MAG TPA: ATP-dependent DNA helicase [Burkholderiales bacterium]|nr:ATP-dependent DNA helicase [Burkholderiales bacterium]
MSPTSHQQAQPATTSSCAEALDDGGPLAVSISGFTPRPAQREMAAAIERVLADTSVFIAESGTGTGKTFAYLVPVLLSGKKTIISTGTRHLQDQIYHRDLPQVRDALKVPVSVALLKGRANYLCHHRLARTAAEGRFTSRAQTAEFQKLVEWARRTRRGDIGEVSEVSEDSELWPLVTSTADNCLGSSCSDFDKCCVNAARREALAADVVVVNHHLFFADIALRDEGFAQLLPGVEAVVFDEAHQLAEIASVFFGQSLSASQLNGLSRDTIAEDVREKSGVAGLPEAAHKLEKAAADFRLAFAREPKRDALAALEDDKAFHHALAELAARLDGLAAALALAAPKGQGLANCHRRALELSERLTRIRDATSDYVSWYETTVRGFSLYLTPLDISGPFRGRIENSGKAWLFTSATLAINKSFTHFQKQLGLENAETGLWDSPFDYAGNTLLYLPSGLPNPGSPDYTTAVIEAALPVLAASRGRAFLLFTSHRALRLAKELLQGRVDHPLLVQGEAPRSALLERFRSLGNAVLLGTGSFWEGVDVRGEALSCVIIDKLPFATPDDPVLQARGRAMEEEGRNPFMEYQLPTAVIALKQGAGRLIRDENDRGVLMLCDPRLLSRPYGKTFLASLPPMPRTRALADIEKFFQSH